MEVLLHFVVISIQIFHNLECATEHPEITEDLTELASMTNVIVKHHVVAGVGIEG